MRSSSAGGNAVDARGNPSHPSTISSNPIAVTTSSAAAAPLPTSASSSSLGLPPSSPGWHHPASPSSTGNALWPSNWSSTSSLTHMQQSASYNNVSAATSAFPPGPGSAKPESLPRPMMPGRTLSAPSFGLDGAPPPPPPAAGGATMVRQTSGPTRSDPASQLFSLHDERLNREMLGMIQAHLVSRGLEATARLLGEEAGIAGSQTPSGGETSEVSLISSSPLVSGDRLMNLVRQGCAYQVLSTRSKKLPSLLTTPANRPGGSPLCPQIDTLLSDYEPTLLPLGPLKRGSYPAPIVLGRHAQAVKCVAFVGLAGDMVVSGSNDNSIAVWRVPHRDDDLDGVFDEEDEGEQTSLSDLAAHEELESIAEDDRRQLSSSSSHDSRRASGAGPHPAPGRRRSMSSPSHPGSSAPLFTSPHPSRVWDVTSTRDGRFVVSVCADGLVRTWETTEEAGRNKPAAPPAAVRNPRSTHATLHEGDAYSVCFHPDGKWIATSGYDKTSRLMDFETGQTIRTFSGHTGSVTQVSFGSSPKLMASASKDCTVRIVDIASGTVVRTLAQRGEATGVGFHPSGDKVVVAVKDSSNRVVDLRGAQPPVPVVRLKGHLNASKSFVRAEFAGKDGSVVIGGSEDARIYAWDTSSGKLLRRAKGHESGAVFRAAWNQERGLVASCGEDGTVRLWTSS